MNEDNVIPTEIKLLQKERLLEITFENGDHFKLPCEYVRVFSPSAENKEDSETRFPSGKRWVNITGIDPIGNYAVKLIFDDGHSTGIYSWETLFDLSYNFEDNWVQYLKTLSARNEERDPPVN